MNLQFLRRFVAPILWLLTLACAAHNPASISKPSSIAASCSPGVKDGSSITGVVLDSMKRPVIAATITVLSRETMYMGTTTKEDGTFVLPWVPAATYIITVQAVGYAKVTSEAYVLPPKAVLRLTCTMVEDAEGAFFPTPKAPMIDPKSTTIGVVIYNDDNGFPRVESK